MTENETPRRELVLPRELYVAFGVLVAGAVLYALSAVLTPLLLAFAIAYVFDPLIDRFEALGIPRAAGIAIVLLAALGVLVALVALVLPSLATEVASVASEVPGKISALVTSAEPWLTAHGVRLPHTTKEWVERLLHNANQMASTLVASAGGFLSLIVSRLYAMVGSIVAILVVPVLSVYFLNDFDRITAGIRGLLPRRYRRIVTEYAKEIDATLSHFLRGQLAVMAILGVLYGTAYAILGVRLSGLIGFTAGVLSFIPYVGSAFALISGLLMSLLGGFHPGQLLGIVIAYSIVQALEGFVIAPRVMGKSLGLPEVWVLIALFVGGEIFGFLGVLLAAPLAAIAKVFVSRAVGMYQESDLYLDGPASLRSIPPAEPLNRSSVPPPNATSSPGASRTPLAGSVVPPTKKERPSE